MKKILILLSLFLCLVIQASYAQSSGLRLFDATYANNQLRTVNSQISRNIIGRHYLEASVDNIERLQANARVCINKSDEQLNIINELLKSTELDSSMRFPQDDYAYLQTKKIQYAKQRSQCRLFIYQSKELVLALNESIQQLTKHQILEHSTPIWQIYETKILHGYKKISTQTIYKASGINKLSNAELIVCLVLFILALIVGFFIWALCKRWLIKHPSSSSAVISLVARVKSFIVWLAVLAVICVFLQSAFSGMLPIPTLKHVANAIFAFILLLAIATYFFKPDAQGYQVLRWPLPLGISMFKRITVLLVWIVFGYLVSVIFSQQSLAKEFSELARTIFITVLSCMVIWTSWLFSQIPQLKFINQVCVLAIKIALSILLLFMIVTEWLGYHELALFLVSGIILSALTIAATALIWYLIDMVYQQLDHPQSSLADSLRYIFGVKNDTRLNELVFIRVVAYGVLLALAILSLLHIWGVSGNTIDIIINGLVDGVRFSKSNIVPLRIAIALIVFTCLLLIGRFIATKVARRQQFEGEQDVQVAIASIIFYIVFALALLFALLIMGVDFTSLAIIAGALSVGIGLGLQNIANNFISGVILLLEKPIKPGDRVIVGTTEGFVKKVRIRSTQITTLAKEDVIVPNAELISSQVTNYMFRDRMWRIICPVGVAYGSDIDNVKRCLLEVATQNNDVLQVAPNQPSVFFRSFGDSSLEFELWCIIHDVNKKHQVVSDLNFAIDNIFRVNDITIAFPQRDIHVKEHVVVQEGLSPAS